MLPITYIFPTTSEVHYKKMTLDTKENMLKDNLITGKEARDKLIAGITKVSNAVGSTMGTGGSNAIIEAMETPGHLMTNDGFSIANAIHLADPIEEMGRKILFESINRANNSSGDGSSTTCVVTAEIIKEGLKHVDNVSSMELKRSLEAVIPVLEAMIDEQKKDIAISEVGKVASISAEDAEIGATIQEIYEQIGKSGVIHWDISKTEKDSYTVGKGITVDGAGYISPYMCDIDEKTGQFLNVARWKKPKILLTKQKITSASEFNDLFQALFNKEIKEIVVFCDEIEAPVIADLIKTRAVRGFKTLVVKMPVLWKDQWYEDLAKATGATVIDPVLGISLKTASLEQLGTVENITVSSDTTFIDGIKDLKEYTDSMEDEVRKARLNTQTARYFVGAHSDSALSYRRLKVEDAISAAWQALNGGVVAGGGVCLRECASKLKGNSIGVQVLAEALLAPEEQIAANAGQEPYVGAESNTGLDTRTGEYVNMFDAGIMDPANVVKNAIRNAISVAAAVLSASAVVSLPRQEMPQQQMPVVL